MESAYGIAAYVVFHDKWSYPEKLKLKNAIRRHIRNILVDLLRAVVESAIFIFNLIAENGGWTAHYTCTAMRVICEIYYDVNTRNKRWSFSLVVTF